MSLCVSDKDMKRFNNKWKLEKIPDRKRSIKR